MARYIPKWLGPIVEELELERPTLVSVTELTSIIETTGVQASTYIVADRLRKLGWLLKTPQRGVWEFSPGENAGAYSTVDALIPLQAFLRAHPHIKAALTMQTAAWALNLADRVPTHIEVAFSKRSVLRVPPEISVTIFESNLDLIEAKGAPCLRPESIVVQMAQKPTAINSWQGVVEWLPDLAYEMDALLVLMELEGRLPTVWARTGYLISGMRPDIAKLISKEFVPKSKTRFGTRTAALRNDERWKISDTILPFDPRELEPVNSRYGYRENLKALPSDLAYSKLVCHFPSSALWSKMTGY